MSWHIKLFKYFLNSTAGQNPYIIHLLMVTCFGPLATINCELRQVRKEATVAVTLGAGVWLGRVAT